MKKKLVLVLLVVVLLVTLSTVALAKRAPRVKVVTTVSTMAEVKTTTGQRLIVRDKADFSGKVVGYLNCGTKVQIQKVKNGFAKVSVGSVSGYVWKKDLANEKPINQVSVIAAPRDN